MAIYGTGLLSICLLVGLLAGQALGMLLGIDKNIGGVGIAMLVLIVATERLQRSGRLEVPTQQGILFWSSVYIPVVVAMAASQNVLKAIKAGPLAILAGVLSVVACFALVPLIGRTSDSTWEPDADELA